MNDDTKLLVVGTALRKMFKQGHFSICTVDSCLEVLGIARGGETYRQLHALHCVDYADMPRELADRIPGMLQRVFGNVNVRELAIACTPAENDNGSKALRIIR